MLTVCLLLLLQLSVVAVGRDTTLLTLLHICVQYTQHTHTHQANLLPKISIMVGTTSVKFDLRHDLPQECPPSLAGVDSEDWLLIMGNYATSRQHLLAACTEFLKESAKQSYDVPEGVEIDGLGPHGMCYTGE